MGLTNTEIVKAREKKLRDCLLSPETEHIDSCFDSEDEGDACERVHGGDTWRKRFASATCGITSNSFWKKIRRLRSVPKQVWEERALLMDERRRQNKTPGSRHPTEGSQRDYQGKRTCPEPGEFRGPLRETTHPDGSVGASSKPLLFWRPRVASSNDIHHQVTVAASSSMIDATHPQVVRLSSPPRNDVLAGANRRATVVDSILRYGCAMSGVTLWRTIEAGAKGRAAVVASMRHYGCTPPGETL
eukprot:jgi/Undpi1/4639/HiC_scaffold_18.g07993.m1